MLLPLDLAARRAAVAPGTSLGTLADALTTELAPLLHAALPIPEHKARLTRIGGRCPVHGVLLDFDPWHPHAHHCRHCGSDYRGTEHDQWWAMGAQLWTAERAVHAAALYALRGDTQHRDLAERILAAMADRYMGWPNRDNVLGPSRPFFSTYLESIWLLNLCHALRLLEAASGGTAPGQSAHAVGQQVRDRLIAPSSALIASFHEGRSNRQVWNEIAVLSAETILGNTGVAVARAHDSGSLVGLLRDGLLPDGTWYEGENYHQFAHRGLWYGVQWMQATGVPLDPALAARFHEGFVTPFAGLLPDETLPARRDSQYAVSVRQWRWAEWCELAYAHRADARIAGLLSRLYDPSTAPHGVTADLLARGRSTADAERNGPPSLLSRSSCSWRALLMANPDPVPAGQWTPASTVQPEQGLAVIRREQARVYVALEGGATGGGHGHPDRLGLTLQIGAQRLLDDPGTGSYVERTLHWYRSTLAHHAPLVDGASQQKVAAQLLAFEDRGGAGWIAKRVEGLAAGVQATRRVIVCDGYLVDVLDWESAREITLTLPIACAPPGVECRTNLESWQDFDMAGAGGLEDGFDFLEGVQQAMHVPATVHVDLSGSHGSATRRSAAWYATSSPATWWRATAPGAPGADTQLRYYLSQRGTAGRIVGVWSWAPEGTNDQQVTAAGVVLTPAAEAIAVAAVTTVDGTTASHEPAPHGWHIGLVARHSRSSIDLEGLVSPTAVPGRHTEAAHDQPPTRAYALPGVADAAIAGTGEVIDGALHFTLRGRNYVRTEEAWDGDNRPEALVSLAVSKDTLVVRVSVHIGRPPHPGLAGTAAIAPDNPLDNERTDVNADGLQCFVGSAHSDAWEAGVLVVPTEQGRARVTTIAPHSPVPVVRAHHSALGWTAQLAWPLDALPPGTLRVALAVNECPPWRERRRGQLVLGGGGGFGYLRGDRLDSAQAIHVTWPGRAAAHGPAD